MSDNISNNKRIAKNTLFMYFRMFITMAVGLYASRVILSNLGFSDYGLFNVIGGIVAMFTIVSGTLYNAAMRFISFYQGQDNLRKQQEVYSMTMYIHIILAILVIVFGETIGLWYLHNKLVIPEGREYASEWLYQLSIFTAALSLINVPFNATIIAHEKMSMFAYISIFDVLMKLLFVIALAWVPMDKLIFLATCYFVLAIVDRIIYGIYCSRKFKETHLICFWDRALFKEIFSFSGWGLFGSASYICNTQGINLLINSFFGTGINAARGIAVQVENIVRQFMSNVQTAINPQITKSYAANDLQRMFSLVFASSRYCYYLMLLMILPLGIVAPYILSIWLGDYPEHTVIFLRMILANTILDSMINPLWTANNATGKVKVYYLSVDLVTILFFPIMYICLKIYHVPVLVFIVLLLSSLIGIATRLVIIKRNLGMSISNYSIEVIKPIFYVTILSSVFPLLCMMMFDTNCFIGALVEIIVTVASVSLAIYFCGIREDERLVLQKRIKIILAKVRRKKDVSTGIKI